MKLILIAPLAVVSTFFVACEQKSNRAISSIPAPTLTPSEAAEASDYSGVTSPSVAETSPQEQVAPSPSASATPGVRPTFKSEAATQAANQYLDSYGALINDLNATPQPPIGNPEATMSYFRTYTQKLARDNAELANRQKEVESQLTPNERKLLRQYQKSLEQPGQDQ
jgi:hypothetical protein